MTTLKLSDLPIRHEMSRDIARLRQDLHHVGTSPQFAMPGVLKLLADAITILDRLDKDLRRLRHMSTGR